MAKPALTEAIQDYLREIYKLGTDGGRVSVTARWAIRRTIRTGTRFPTRISSGRPGSGPSARADRWRGFGGTGRFPEKSRGDELISRLARPRRDRRSTAPKASTTRRARTA